MFSFDQKFYVLAAGIIFATLLGLTGFRYVSRKVYFVLLLSGIIFYEPLSISFDSDVYFKGSTRGLGFLFCDFILLAYVINLSRTLKNGIRIDIPLVRLWAMYVLVIMFTIVFGLENNDSMELYALFLVVKSIILYVILFNLFDSEKAYGNFVLTFAFMFGLLGLYALYERYVIGIHRVFTVFEHPNLAGTVNLMAFTFLYTIFLSDKKYSNKQYLLILGGIFGAALGVLFTVSRGSFALLVVATFAISLFSLHYCFDHRRLHIKGSLVLIGAVGVLVKVFDTFRDRILQQEVFYYSGGGRTEMNDLALDMFTQYPFGVGYNSFTTVSSLFGGDALHAASPASGYSGLPPVHNFYLLTLVELGILGLVVYSLLMFIQTRRFFSLLKARRRQRVPNFRNIVAIASFFALTAAYAHQLVESTLRSPPAMYLQCVFLVLLMKNLRLIRRKIEPI